MQIVCPDCHAELKRGSDGGLRCSGCGAYFPRVAQVDVLMDNEQWSSMLGYRARHEGALERYSEVRRNSPLTIMYYDWWVERLLSLMPSARGCRFLELMCGDAEISRRAGKLFSEIAAIDLDVRAVERAACALREQGWPCVHAVCANAARLPLADNSIDIIAVQGALHHARPVLPQIVSEISRVLRPGGVLVGSEPANDSRLIERIRRWQYSRTSLHDKDEAGFTREELRSLFSEHGMRLEEYKLFGHVAYPLMCNTDLISLLARCRRRWLGSALLGLDWFFERLPVVRGAAWVSSFRAVNEKQ